MPGPVALLVVACDRQKIAEPGEGVATEADLRRRFGEPVAAYPDDRGARTFEYPRRPEGRRNDVITVGADGRMSALRQVRTRASFAKVTLGLDKAQLRCLLGRPAKTQFCKLRRQEVWNWRRIDGAPNASFPVTFDRDGRVLATAAGPDRADTTTGGR